MSRLASKKGTPWVAYINKNFLNSYGCGSPQKISKFTIKTKWILFII